MNEINELIELTEQSALEVFDSGHGIQEILDRARDEIMKFEHDMSTATSRKKTNSLAYKVKRLKTRLDDVGKKSVSELKVRVKNVDQNRKVLRDGLDELKEQARQPLTNWEEAEAARIKCLQEKIRAIEAFSPRACGYTRDISTLQSDLETVKSLDIDDSFEELVDRALNVQADVIYELEQFIESERRRIELEKVWKANKEREEVEKKRAIERQQAELQQQAMQKAAEQARIKAEREAEERVLQAKIAEREAAEKAEKERVRAEMEKHAREQAEARTKQEAEKAAEQAKKEAERKHQEAAAKQKAEDEARAADRKHQIQIHKECMQSVLALDIDLKTSAKIVAAIAKGMIKHVRIEY